MRHITGFRCHYFSTRVLLQSNKYEPGGKSTLTANIHFLHNSQMIKSTLRLQSVYLALHDTYVGCVQTSVHTAHVLDLVDIHTQKRVDSDLKRSDWYWSHCIKKNLIPVAYGQKKWELTCHPNISLLWGYFTCNKRSQSAMCRLQSTTVFNFFLGSIGPHSKNTSHHGSIYVFQQNKVPDIKNRVCSCLLF